MEALMRAVEYTRYGDAGELAVRQVPRPAVSAGRVLVRVHGSSVNPTDVEIRAGRMRLMTGRRFPKRIGLDFAGEVVAVDSDGVTGVAVGERVWGFLSDISGRTGAAAEYVSVKPAAISTAPVSVDLVMARSRRADLAALADRVDQGILRPVVEEVYPLEEVGRAHRAAETGHARGKKVIAVR